MSQRNPKPAARPNQKAPGSKSLSSDPPNSAMVEIDPIVDQWLQQLVKIAIEIAAREHREKGDIDGGSTGTKSGRIRSG